MKKIYLILVSIVLISLSTSASNLKEKTSVLVNIKSIEKIDNLEINSNVAVAFNSIRSLNKFNFDELNTEAAQCTVTVTVSVGIVSVSISATCDCSEVSATIRRLATMAKKELIELT